jgi:L-serine dehydratase
MQHAFVAFSDLFKIGLGPSSSHTMGPMRAARIFRQRLGERRDKVIKVNVRLYGSLAWTGKGHGSDKAITLGLAGRQAQYLDPDEADTLFAAISDEKSLSLSEHHQINFDPASDIVYDRSTVVQRHPNAMDFHACDADGHELANERWYSVGGGFIEREGDDTRSPQSPGAPLPYPYANAESLLSRCHAAGKRISEIALANETPTRGTAEVFQAIDEITHAMLACIERGLSMRGELPGVLRVQRRAADLLARLEADDQSNSPAPDNAMRRVSIYAIAVNEENAAGGRVVTAPTNGAAGVIPAVLRYYMDYHRTDLTPAPIHEFFLTATAIGGIIKRNASISGAELGCQGEVGSAAAMAAAGLTAALGGSAEQIENAAEIAIEHHLGLTCDPVAGLVQIPCIERNAFGAVKAILAASLALQGNGQHRVTLDQAINTMRETGLDMSDKYRETSRGGLAVNVP